MLAVCRVIAEKKLANAAKWIEIGMEMKGEIVDNRQVNFEGIA
jgi:hypothetical protein